MAILYVDDGGSNTSPFDTWAKACTGGIDAAMDDAACVAGSTIYVGHDSTKTYTANVTYSSQGTFASPVHVISADNTSGEPPTTYTAGAIEDADGGFYDLVFSGHSIFYGITFKSGDDISFQTGNTANIFHFCTLEMNGNIGTDSFYIGQDGDCIELYHTNVKFGHADQGFYMFGQGNLLKWHGGTLQTTDVAQLVEVCNSGGRVDVKGVDLSVISGGALMNGWGSTSDDPCVAVFFGCKLNTIEPSLVTDSAAIAGIQAAMISCYSTDSATYPYSHWHTSEGDVYTDTAEYLDAKYDGTNGYSYKMVTNTNASFYRPLRFKLWEGWCAANPTLTVHLTHDINGDNSDATDHDFWIEVQRPTASNAAFKGWDYDSKGTPLATPTDLTTEGDPGWNAGQGAYNSIAETMAGGAAGVHVIWACMGVASKTIYVDPKVDIT